MSTVARWTWRRATLAYVPTPDLCGDVTYVTQKCGHQIKIKIIMELLFVFIIKPTESKLDEMIQDGRLHYSSISHFSISGHVSQEYNQRQNLFPLLLNNWISNFRQ